MQNVFVGVSGGVDSAVSAALLKEQGHRVTGVFIKIWQPEFVECTWKEDRLDAMRVCAALGIPFRELDLSEVYKRSVVEAMIADYASGRTPNPDVLCNREVKFGAFATWAREQGADMIATGHYARVRTTNGINELLRGKDVNKDQSYFLFRLEQTGLSKVLFPVGALPKAEVRALAKRFALPVAGKADSQGLCFVGDVSMRDFLTRFIPLTEGPVMCGEKIIGKHEGAALYTIGQRHGFGETPDGPYYITAIDTEKNIIRVSSERSDAARSETSIADIHWIGGSPRYPFRTFAQARYREAAVPVTIHVDGERYRVTFDSPHIFSAGQSIVFYEHDACLGGATIA